MDGMVRKEIEFNPLRVRRSINKAKTQDAITTTNDDNNNNNNNNIEKNVRIERTIKAYVVGGKDVLKTWLRSSHVVLLLPNEQNFKAKSIRILADEVAFNTQAIVVVPDIYRSFCFHDDNPNTNNDSTNKENNYENNVYTEENANNGNGSKKTKKREKFSLHECETLEDFFSNQDEETIFDDVVSTLRFCFFQFDTKTFSFLGLGCGGATALQTTVDLNDIANVCKINEIENILLLNNETNIKKKKNSSSVDSEEEVFKFENILNDDKKIKTFLKNNDEIKKIVASNVLFNDSSSNNKYSLKNNKNRKLELNFVDTTIDIDDFDDDNNYHDDNDDKKEKSNKKEKKEKSIIDDAAYDLFSKTFDDEYLNKIKKNKNKNSFEDEIEVLENDPLFNNNNNEKKNFFEKTYIENNNNNNNNSDDDDSEIEDEFFLKNIENNSNSSSNNNNIEKKKNNNNDEMDIENEVVNEFKLLFSSSERAKKNKLISNFSTVALKDFENLIPKSLAVFNVNNFDAKKIGSFLRTPSFFVFSEKDSFSKKKINSRFFL
jgi:hypothetical protein